VTSAYACPDWHQVSPCAHTSLQVQGRARHIKPLRKHMPAALFTQQPLGGAQYHLRVTAQVPLLSRAPPHTQLKLLGCNVPQAGMWATLPGLQAGDPD
jgi:hypothetical protein